MKEINTQTFNNILYNPNDELNKQYHLNRFSELSEDLLSELDIEIGELEFDFILDNIHI